MNSRNDVYDLIGIGFGPSNLALAVRLAESASTASLRRAFVERQPEFGWHRGMLLDDSRMQISFLKDLVMMRDPKSRFTFVNYLFEHGRLQDFVNLKQSYPTRIEFHDYLRWVARAFDDEVGYGEAVTRIEPVFDPRDSGIVTHVRVHSADTSSGRERQRTARAISIGVGGAPSVPKAFAALAGARNAPIIHSSGYLSAIGRLLGDGGTRRRVAVVGAGQSAAEVFVDLTRRFAQVDTTLIMRAAALKPADDSPFVNEIFNPAYTDVVYAQSDEARRATMAVFRDTNYSVVDRPLIEHIYALFYQQRVEGRARHRLLANTSVESARLVAREEGPDEIELTLHGGEGGQSSERFDAVVLATGYRRDEHLTLLEGLTEALGEAPSRCAVARDYRLCTGAHFQPRIYLQGCCEDTHGLSDTLLSVLACRADEIAESLVKPWAVRANECEYRLNAQRDQTSDRTVEVA